jgi:hypothetical protein
LDEQERHKRQERNSCIFHGSIAVTPIEEPLLLPWAEAEKWMPIEFGTQVDHMA